MGLGVLIETKVRDDEAARARAKPQANNRWHAVSIAAAAGACDAARACKGKRFLSREAPRLPLPECNAARCECKYRHYADRRGGPRRGDEKGVPKARVDANRRGTRGRRAVDSENSK